MQRTEKDLLKEQAAREAVSLLKDGMVVGLGTGSTMQFALDLIGEQVARGLSITGIATSGKTSKIAGSLGIPLADPVEVDRVDLAIDGADEVDKDFCMIKGGGGALLREKIVACAAEQVVIIVDEGKLVKQLGRHPVPVEIVPFGLQLFLERMRRREGIRITLRQERDEVYLTDSGNYIVDCFYGEIESARSLHSRLLQDPSVVETGIFVGLLDILIVGRPDGAERINVYRNEGAVSERANTEVLRR